jgi:hypothetical protein
MMIGFALHSNVCHAFGNGNCDGGTVVTDGTAVIRSIS